MKVYPDTLITCSNYQLDSIEGAFNNGIDSLKQSYGHAKGSLEALKSNYQKKIDSLNNLKLSTERYTGRIDSLNERLAQVQTKISSQLDSMKTKIASKIESLNLPPEAGGKIESLTSSLDKVSLSSIDSEMGSKWGIDKLNGPFPNLPSTGSIDPSLPSTNLPNPNIPNVNLPNVNAPNLGVGEQLGKANPADIQGQVKEAASIENAGKVIESNVAELDQGNLPIQPPANGDEAKEQLKDVAKKEAVNHLAGKEVVVQQAMDKMSKYKQKYNSVSSLKDLPVKAANPLKEKPFIERLVPGVTLQLQNFQHFMLDVNASAGYKFTQRITAGLGWNQRWAFNGGEFFPSERIFGVRSYGEYHFKKGFALRADVEYMNALEKENLVTATEALHREWVWSFFTGVKQEYRISKLLKGNAQVMYNVYDPRHKSPYVDRLNVRMGFEFALKKKKKN
jgi:hypothetical protein